MATHWKLDLGGDDLQSVDVDTGAAPSKHPVKEGSEVLLMSSREPESRTLPDHWAWFQHASVCEEVLGRGVGLDFPPRGISIK